MFRLREECLNVVDHVEISVFASVGTASLRGGRQGWMACTVPFLLLWLSLPSSFLSHRE